MQAIKAQRKALKVPKSIYAEEKMTLEDAIAVLRVSVTVQFPVSASSKCVLGGRGCEA